MNRKKTVQLGLNVDHIATVRQARGGKEPSVLQAALDGIRGGASGITVHLREDRRHIQDRDVLMLKQEISVPLNLEMSIADEIVRFACKVRPAKACLVPERRAELTTEGGLDVVRGKRQIADAVSRLQDKGIIVSLFIDPLPKQIQAAYDIDTDFIELHTGCYSNLKSAFRKRELDRLRKGAAMAHTLEIGVNAGHGLDYENVGPVAHLPYMEELNIGHAIVARSLFIGLKAAVSEMCVLIKQAS